MTVAAASAFAPIQPSLGRAGPFGLSYRELAPAPALASDVVCFWEIESGAHLSEPFPYRIAPDGCVDLVFDVANGGAWIFGTQVRRSSVDLIGEVALFGIRIRPGRLEGVLSHPAGAVAGRSFALDEVLGREAHALEDRLRAPRSAASRAALATSLLLGRRKDAPRRTLDTAVTDAIVATGGGQRVGAIAHAHGITARHLQRLCFAATGLSPKQLARVVRFQRALRCLTLDPAPQLAALALDLGFFDQAHLTNELRALLGTTPGALRRATQVSEISNPQPPPVR